MAVVTIREVKKQRPNNLKTPKVISVLTSTDIAQSFSPTDLAITIKKVLEKENIEDVYADALVQRISKSATLLEAQQMFYNFVLCGQGLGTLKEYSTKAIRYKGSPTAGLECHSSRK